MSHYASPSGGKSFATQDQEVSYWILIQTGFIRLSFSLQYFGKAKFIKGPSSLKAQVLLGLKCNQRTIPTASSLTQSPTSLIKVAQNVVSHWQTHHYHHGLVLGPMAYHRSFIRRFVQLLEVLSKECQVLFAYLYPTELVLDHCLPQKTDSELMSNWLGRISFAYVSGRDATVRAEEDMLV
ncbi:hypothetical protein Tco_1002195 [Tanacetum coccineum]|uniref:Uncharacterized protein n=1 Tax=Tanacetum coccineum TaxID=301880 RepID=A0ABQ5F7F6_9ASTR